MSEIESLLSRLESHDLRTRIRTCIEIGRLPTRAGIILPTLRSFVEQSRDFETDDVGLAIRAIGQLLGYSALINETGKIPNSFLVYLVYLLEQLQCPIPIYVTSVIFALSLVGKAGASANAHDAVRSSVERTLMQLQCIEKREKLKYRAYQYASNVNHELLYLQPWLSYIPPTDELRLEWNMERLLPDYYPEYFLKKRSD